MPVWKRDIRRNSAPCFSKIAFACVARLTSSSGLSHLKRVNDVISAYEHRPSGIWSLGGAAFSSRFFRISPADAVALSLALRALTAGKAFSGVAKNSVREPTRASVRPARAILLCSEGQCWRALSTTIPLCCNYCRSSHASRSVFFQKFIPYIATESLRTRRRIILGF